MAHSTWPLVIWTFFISMALQNSWQTVFCFFFYTCVAYFVENDGGNIKEGLDKPSQTLTRLPHGRSTRRRLPKHLFNYCFCTFLILKSWFEGLTNAILVGALYTSLYKSGRDISYKARSRGKSNENLLCSCRRRLY